MTTMTATKPRVFTPSPQQAAVFDFVSNARGSAFIEAVAGAGKTTTLVEALKLMKGYVNFAAYNKKIADEIKEKTAKLGFGNRVRVGTFHSFGFGAWRRAYPDVKSGPEAADEKAAMTKAHLLAKFGEGNFVLEQQVHKTYALVMKLVGLAKQRLTVINDRQGWQDIVDHFDLAYEIEDEGLIALAISYAQEALAYHISIATKIIDFDDMIYMPVISNIKIWQNDWLLVDEAQDTNPARRALARKMLNPRFGRALFVGDRHQAIYGFTGADNDAVDQIIRDFGCKLLPLTITYRCPQSVVAEARMIVSHITAHETAPVGSVTSLELAADIFGQGLTHDDAILCRKTKPLVDLAFQLIRRKTPCHVEGRDIGLGLLKLVNRWNSVQDLGDLRDRLLSFHARETTKLIEAGKEQQADNLTDRIETIVTLMNNSKDLDDLRAQVATMFVDTDGNTRKTLTLSTVHKSKGREWERVFILGRDEFMPSPYARQQWDLDQENNLIYVAVTRAKDQLVYVPAPPPDDDSRGRLLS
jgi:DNA helicase II / ATP-dependent DNA helicase PcrA